jgi:hypothetical protein
MGTHLIRRFRALAHPKRTGRRSSLAEALERRVLLSSTVCFWTGGGVGDQFSSAGNWENNTAPTQPGETAEFLAGATVSLDVPVHNDGTVVVGGSSILTLMETHTTLIISRSQPGRGAARN